MKHETTGPWRPERSVILMLFLLGLAAWPGTGITSEPQTLRLGLVPVVDTLPLMVAREEGLFTREGLDVQLVSFQSALERDAALQAGRLDGYFGDLLNSILLVNAGQKLAIVTTAFHTSDRDRVFGLVVGPKSDIKTLANLRDQVVAISRATIIEYLLDRFLTAQGLKPNFVAKREIKQIPIRLQMLLEEQIPAAVLPEPLLTLAEMKGGRVLADDRTLDTCLTVVALNRERMARDPTLTPRFLRAYAAAVERINQDPAAFKPLLLARASFPEPVKERYRVPHFPAVGPPSEKDVTAVMTWLTANRLSETTRPYADLVWSPGSGPAR